MNDVVKNGANWNIPSSPGRSVFPPFRSHVSHHFDSSYKLLERIISTRHTSHSRQTHQESFTCKPLRAFTTPGCPSPASQIMPPKRQNARPLITKPPTTASDMIFFYHLNVKPYDIFCQWKPLPIMIPISILLTICDAPTTPSVLAALDTIPPESTP